MIGSYWSSEQQKEKKGLKGKKGEQSEKKKARQKKLTARGDEREVTVRFGIAGCTVHTVRNGAAAVDVTDPPALALATPST